MVGRDEADEAEREIRGERARLVEARYAYTRLARSLSSLVFSAAMDDSHSSKYHYKDIAFLMHIARSSKIPEYPMQFVSNNGSNCQGIARMPVYLHEH